MLLTRAPLSTDIATHFSFDLHVLGTPPAFVLSQDQTLRRKFNLILFYITQVQRTRSHTSKISKSTSIKLLLNRLSNILNQNFNVNLF